MRYRPLFRASVAVALLAVVVAWWSLPTGRIPIHFTAGGTPDGWGTRTELLGLLLPLTAALAWLMGWLASRTLTMSWVYLNVPHKQYWSRPENEARARARLQEDGYLIAAGTMWLMTLLPVAVASSVRRAAETGTSGWWDMALVLTAAVLLVVGVFLRQRWYGKNRAA